jgi:hypothetical protein
MFEQVFPMLEKQLIVRCEPFDGTDGFSGRRFADWRAELAWLSRPCMVQKTGGWLSKLARLFGIETLAQERRDIGGLPRSKTQTRATPRVMMSRRRYHGSRAGALDVEHRSLNLSAVSLIVSGRARPVSVNSSSILPLFRARPPTKSSTYTYAWR